MKTCYGAFCQLRDLIEQRHSGSQLDLVQRNRALSLLAGPNKTNFRGRGIDFEEVRSYQPGDDIRTIDWRVTARTGSAHTKMFREERERPVLVVTDQRNAMFFGSINCFKSVLACHCAALLSWAALNQGDRIGGLVFSDAQHSEVRPRRSRRSVLAYLHQLAAYNGGLPVSADNDTEQAFTRMLIELRRIARPGCAIFIVSDFSHARAASAMKHLHQLSRHTEITAIHCADELEAKLPASGRYRVTNGSEKTDLSTGDAQLQAQYSARFTEELDLLRAEYRKLGIPLIELTTAAPPLGQLLPIYGDRRKRLAAL